MNKWLKVSISAIAIFALSIVALGALTFSQSYAQSGTDNDGRSSFGERVRNMAQNFGQGRFGSGRGGRGHGKGMADKAGVVAEALGITVDDLKAAREAGKSLADLQEELGIDAETFQANLKTAAIAQINQKLADGDITQEKADAWIEKIESSEFNMGGRGHGKGQGRGHGKGHGKGVGHGAEIVAEALGITVDDLKAAREAGKSLADLQDELGIDAETFQANLKTAAIAQVNQKLADGDITQEKADTWIEKIESSEFNMGGRGHGKGHGRGHDGNKHDDNDAETEESDTDTDAVDDEQSADADADADGAGAIAATDPLFRVVGGQAGDMSLYLPMMSSSNN